MELLILFFAVALIFSFLCSMWEAVLLSVSPAYATREIDAGSTIGHQLKRFKDNIDQPLAAILTLNTIAHTVGAIGVGAQANRIWADSHPLITSLAIPAVMTAAILVLSEIVPKTLGATAWQRLAPFTVRSLRILVAALRPIVWLSQLITRSLKSGFSEPVLTRSDFSAMAKLGVEEGVIAKGESAIIGSLLRFRSLRVKDLMTPRTVMVMASTGQTIEEFLSDNPGLRFSRIPLYQGQDRDDIAGFVLKTDLLAHMVQGEGHLTLGEVQRELPAIPQTAPVYELFDQFLDRRMHIALVVDEFGATRGVVTMEDLIETLLGTEIVDELDHAEDMQAYARRLWQARARRLGLVEAEPPEQES